MSFIGTFISSKVHYTTTILLTERGSRISNSFLLQLLFSPSQSVASMLGRQKHQQIFISNNLTIWSGQQYFSYLSFSQNFFTFQFLKNQYSTTFSQNICSPFLIPLNHIQAQRMCSPASKNCQALDKCYISTYQTKVELSREVSG